MLSTLSSRSNKTFIKTSSLVWIRWFTGSEVLVTSNVYIDVRACCRLRFTVHQMDWWWWMEWVICWVSSGFSELMRPQMILRSILMLQEPLWANRTLPVLLKTGSISRGNVLLPCLSTCPACFLGLRVNHEYFAGGRLKTDMCAMTWCHNHIQVLWPQSIIYHREVVKLL